METNAQWEEFLNSETPVVLQAGAGWCRPCTALKPMISAVAKDYEGKVKYVYMDIDKFPDLSEMLEIQNIPKTFLIYNGELIDSFGGLPNDPEKISDFFERAVEAASGETQQAAEPEQDNVHTKAGFIVEKLNEGTGPVCPKGANVKVHYTGKFTDGSVFDSSVERGEPLEFTVGMGQVIRGWDEGITQLQKGQKAILTCPPAYAYGTRGAGGVIPPNATLIFDVELIDFK